jgi:hypothetical protein
MCVYKKASGKTSMTWPESMDQGLEDEKGSELGSEKNLGALGHENLFDRECADMSVTP